MKRTVLDLQKDAYPEENAPGLRQYQRDALTMLRARLDPTAIGFDASEPVRAALQHEAVATYFRAWVLPLVDLAAGSGYRGQRNDVAYDANVVRGKRHEALRAKELKP
ncbi:MAG TPA: hypothetical protein VFA39_15825 [Steroidobacteraceae bacterium]|nr:hypothetical protein [Steroidobacteraceae bacterium]